MTTTITQFQEQKNIYELLLENDAFICFNLFEQVLFCVSHPHNQWCSLVFCSEYTVIYFFLLTRTRAASHKHHHTH